MSTMAVRLGCVLGNGCPTGILSSHGTRLNSYNEVLLFTATQPTTWNAVSSHGLLRATTMRSTPSFKKGTLRVLVTSSSLGEMQPSHREYQGIVITGGTRGLGYAMAQEFLKAGDGVVICGRQQERVDAAVQSLQKTNSSASVFGVKCDVANPEDVENLSAFAKVQLGTVHTWINNAGCVTANRLLADVEPSDIDAAVRTNVFGSLLCSRQAIRLFRSQPAASSPFPRYHLFNLGFSRWGAAFSRSAATHKATKMALSQLNTALREELQRENIRSIGVHNLSPGMVLTDLLLRDASPVARRFFNVLAEEPEMVAEFLVPRIREVRGSGEAVEYLSPVSAVWRVVSGVPQIVQGGRFFDGNGERVKLPGNVYASNGVRQPY